MGLLDRFRKVEEVKIEEVPVLPVVKKVVQFTTEPDPLTVEPIQPLIQSPIQKESGFLDEIAKDVTNRHDATDIILFKDDRLASIIDLFAKLVSRAFVGIDIEQEGDEEGPRELSDEETALVQTAQIFANRMKFKKLFFSYTKGLLKYGDVIEHIETKPEFLDEELDEQVEATDAITGLTPLPINQLTIIDEQSRIDTPDPTKVITQSNIYVIDEANADPEEEEPVTFPKDEIMHISLDKRSNWKEDLLGRNTYGVWSDSPVDSVRYLVEWKHNLIRSDMLWRQRMVPREHHKLNMLAFDPQNYEGTSFSLRLASAQTAAKLELNKYAASIRGQQTDQGYVTSTDVEIGVVEPKSTNYHEVNLQIDQIDTKMSSITGMPEALSGGETAGFTSLEFSATFVTIRAEEMADTVKEGLERVMYKHLKAVHPSVDANTIKRVKIQTRLILDRDLTERAKIITILTGTKNFTPSEIRKIFGFEALTDVQQQEILDWEEQLNEIVVRANETAGTGGKSPNDTASDVAAEKKGAPTGNQQSKGKRLRDQNAQGERAGERGVPRRG